MPDSRYYNDLTDDYEWYSDDEYNNLDESQQNSLLYDPPEEDIDELEESEPVPEPSQSPPTLQSPPVTLSPHWYISPLTISTISLNPGAVNLVSGGSGGGSGAGAQTIQVGSVIDGSMVAKRTKTPQKDDEQFYNKKLSQVIGFRHGVKKGELGLEIECEGRDLFRSPFKYWSCHEDGSLRAYGGHTPVEYVLREPMGLSEIKDALLYLNEKLKETGSKVIQSTRTSVHVHVNCQKMTVRELFCFLCLYGIFEEPLIEYTGPNRVGNLFCLRAKDSDFYVQMLESVLKHNNFKEWRDDYRYAACNVASIPKFGSLEFRSMEGTIDRNIITLWCEILLMLKQTSLEYDNPREIVEDFLNLGPLPFFKKIFKEKRFSQTIEGTQGLSAKLWDGLRLMRDVAYASEWKPPLKKKHKTNLFQRRKSVKSPQVITSGGISE